MDGLSPVRIASLTLSLLVCSLVGCGTSTESSRQATPSTDSADEQSTAAIAPPQSAQDATNGLAAPGRPISRAETRLPASLLATPIHPPRVVMSKQHEATCLRGIGDSLTDLAFSDASDLSRSVPLKTMLGKRLTVVTFCDLRLLSSRELSSHIHDKIVRPLGEFGVAAVVIHFADNIDVSQSFASMPSLPILVDSDSNYSKIATSAPPRIFLLDKNGNVLWLDIEYSIDMCRELENAVRFHLKQLFETAHHTPPLLQKDLL